MGDVFNARLKADCSPIAWAGKGEKIAVDAEE